MPGEITRDLDNGISAIPAGVAATGTLTQDAEVAGVFVGNGTDFRTEFAKPKLWLFFPDLTPPLLLKVRDFRPADKSGDTVVGQDVVFVHNPPALGTISGESFQIVSATLRELGVLNKGDADAQFDGAIGGSTGTTLPVGQVEQFRITSQTQSSPNDTKDAHWVDATGTLVEIYEQP